jgi:hypothetical protein
MVRQVLWLELKIEDLPNQVGEGGRIVVVLYQVVVNLRISCQNSGKEKKNSSPAWEMRIWCIVSKIQMKTTCGSVLSRIIRVR